jgi:hypothetical protein
MSEIFDPRFKTLDPNPTLHPKRLAHDLAWGVFHKNWPDEFFLEDDHKNNFEFVRQTGDSLGQNHYSLIEYLDKVWGEKLFNPSMLIEQGYLKKGKAINGTYKGTIWVYYLTGKAQALPAEQVKQRSIFISYRRAESSALALLIVARLKEHGLASFLDVHPDNEGLNAGDNWHAELESHVASNDNFIVLIGPKTLESKYVRQEIK